MNSQPRVFDEIDARERMRIRFALGSPLTTSAAARFLGCSASTVRSLIRGGFLDVVPCGLGRRRSHWRISRASLAAWADRFSGRSTKSRIERTERKK